MHVYNSALIDSQIVKALVGALSALIMCISMYIDVTIADLY